MEGITMEEEAACIQDDETLAEENFVEEPVDEAVEIEEPAVTKKPKVGLRGLGKSLAVGFGGLAASAGEMAGKAGRVAAETASKAGKSALDATAAGSKAAIKAAKAGGSKVSDALVTAKTNLDEVEMVDLLDALYGQAVDGIPKVSESVADFANDYLEHSPSTEKAAKALIANQIIKCGTSGFLSGLGGVITLPVTIPANVSSVLYVQMRMIAALAYMGGFDIKSDQVKTLVYACLTGSSAAEILKSAGVQFGQKLTTSTIKSISGKTLTAINQKVGFRFVTKFGEKGIINLGKMVPVVGGIIGGGFDVAGTKVIANNAYKMFIEQGEGFSDDDAIAEVTPEEEKEIEAIIEMVDDDDSLAGELEERETGE